MDNEKIETCRGELDSLINEIDPISENEEYKKLSSDMKKIEQDLKKTLSEKQCELLEDLIDLGVQSSCISDSLNYHLGFESSQFISRIEKIGKRNIEF